MNSFWQIASPFRNHRISRFLRISDLWCRYSARGKQLRIPRLLPSSSGDPKKMRMNQSFYAKKNWVGNHELHINFQVIQLLDLLILYLEVTNNHFKGSRITIPTRSQRIARKCVFDDCFEVPGTHVISPKLTEGGKTAEHPNLNEPAFFLMKKWYLEYEQREPNPLWHSMSHPDWRKKTGSLY